MAETTRSFHRTRLCMTSSCPHTKCRASFLLGALKALSVSQPCLFSPPLSQVSCCLMLTVTMYDSLAASFAPSSLHKWLRSCISHKHKGSSQSKKCAKLFEVKEFRTSTRPGTTIQVYSQPARPISELPSPWSQGSRRCPGRLGDLPGLV